MPIGIPTSMPNGIRATRRAGIRAATVCVLTALAAWLSLSATSRAQGLQITPILIELQPGQMTTTLMVTNKGEVAAALQLRPFQWAQDDGRETLGPTVELAVSPPITTIDAGLTQTFRLVLRNPAIAKEASYRLLLDQLPPPAAPGTIRVALRFSIPVFAEPVARIEKSLVWRISLGSGSNALVGENHGGRHVRILDPVLTRADGSRLPVQKSESPYILAGAARRWPIAAARGLQPGSILHLTAMSDGGPVDATVRVSGR